MLTTSCWDSQLHSMGVPQLLIMLGMHRRLRAWLGMTRRLCRSSPGLLRYLCAPEGLLASLRWG